MNEFDLQISDSIKTTIRHFIENESRIRMIKQSIANHECSIRWLNEQLVTKKLSQANIAEYKHQIRYHEINLAFLIND